jgi:hypothetical protein
MAKEAVSKRSDVDRVISVCSSKDLAVWRVVAKRLPRLINAADFVVVVPENDLNNFEAVTPAAIRVVNEKIYTDRINQILKPKFDENNSARYGWYLQQFIKLIAISEAKADETYLIWDADTVPLKPLIFNTPNRLKYYKATEHHSPYFDTISRLLGLEKIVSHSFIAQCFPAKGAWIKEFISFIELRNGLPWLEAIVEATDFREVSGFSEYETLGTFFSHAYPEEICYTENRWLRSGSSLIGGIDNLDQAFSIFFLSPFDYAAFEVWDDPTRLKQLRKILKKFLLRFRVK